MGSSLLFEIAGLSLTLKCASQKVEDEVIDRYSPFAEYGDAEAPVVTVTCGDLTSVRGDAGGEWPLAISCVGNRVDVESLGVEGWFTTDFTGNVKYDCGKPELLENFFRVLYAFYLLNNGGMLLHAAGVEYRGGGYVFVGQSGSGKSTISRMFRDRGIVYSDDMVAIREEGGRFLLFSTPFRGEETLWLRDRRQIPIEKVLIPVKSDKTYSVVAPEWEALAKIMANVPFVYEVEGAHSRVMRIIDEFVKKVSIHKLYFEKKAPVWEVI